MTKVKNRIGQTYGSLTVVSRADNTPHGKSRWVCVCSCGKQIVAQSDNLQTGRTMSCGHTSYVHGKSNSPAYASWDAMKRRCYDPKHPSFKWYGGSGITVCDEWKESFDQFLLDMGERPDGRSLDRIDYNKGYAPDNCRWATQDQQANNTRSNVVICHNGEKRTATQWSILLGGCRQLVSNRINHGWSTTEAVSIPIGHRRTAILFEI